jgi:hypothetical protein
MQTLPNITTGHIKTRTAKLTSLLSLAVFGLSFAFFSASSVAALAAPNGPGDITAKPVKVYSKTYYPPNSKDTGDFVTISYNPAKPDKISWKGKVTLFNGCQGIARNELNDIYYFAPPGPNDPTFSFNLEVGEKTPIYLSDTQLKNFDKLFSFSWTYPDTKPTNWWDKVNLNKLKWAEKDPASVNVGLYNLKIEGRVLQEGESEKNCVGVRYGMIGRWCKTVIANPRFGLKIASINITNLPQLRQYLGSLSTINKLHFLSDAARGNGWDKGETIYQGRRLIRLQRECTTALDFYEVITTPKTYQLKYLTTIEDNSMPALCE